MFSGTGKFGFGQRQRWAGALLTISVFVGITPWPEAQVSAHGVALAAAAWWALDVAGRGVQVVRRLLWVADRIGEGTVVLIPDRPEDQ